MSLLWYLALTSLLALAGLLVWVASRTHGTARATLDRFNELLKRGVAAGGAEASWMDPAVDRMGGGRLSRWLPASDREELTRLLKQAGWYGVRKRLLFGLISWVIPLGSVAGAGIYVIAADGMAVAQKLALIFIAFALGFLFPRYILRYRANRRRRALSLEMPTAVHLLRMLFDAGLSTEHALRVMHEEGSVLMPILSVELASALQRMDAGHDRAEALGDMAAPLEVAELTDTVAILKQVTRHGGNIRDSLIKFALLMEERQQSALREYVNKLSAKMTVVMMIFLFPALLIFLAGPGFLALAKALLEVYG